jgi:hypothetical protein
MDADKINTYSERYTDGYPDRHQEIEREVHTALNEKGILRRTDWQA